MSERRELVGPPAPRDKYADRLPELVELPEKQRLDLLAAVLALAQGADLFMTDEGTSRYPHQRMSPEEMNRRLTPEEIAKFGVTPDTVWMTGGLREGNPLPGAQDSRGRLVWGALENQALARLREKKPAIGVPATLGAALVHLLLAARWQHDIAAKRGQGKDW